MLTSVQKIRLSVAIAVVALVVVIVVGQWASQPKVDVPDFSQYPAGSERKEAFFGYFLPLVEQRNQEILQTRERVKEWSERADSLSSREERELLELGSRLNISEFDPQNETHWNLLLRRLDKVPPSLALAQAANESAWGTSRFSLEGYNYFGQWCFTKGCGIVPSSRDTGKTHEVASFGTPRQSVESYMQNLNRHNAYKDLRLIRERLRDQGEPITGVALAAGLEQYSERGEEYIKELRSMIRYNELDQYDQ